jgi:O-antigen ligase
MKPLKVNLMVLLQPPIRVFLAIVLGLGFVFTPKASILLLPFLAGISLLSSDKTLNQRFYKSPLLLSLTIFFLWAFISIAWSPVPSYALKSVGFSLILIICALIISRALTQLSPQVSELLIKLLCTAFMISIAFWICGLSLHHWVVAMATWIKGNVSPSYTAQLAYKATAYTVGALSIVTSGWFFAKTRILSGTTCLLLAIALAFSSHSTTAFLGILCGALILCISNFFPRFIGWMLGLTIIAFNAVFPFILSSGLLSQYAQKLFQSYGSNAFSFYHRTIIWEFTLSRWLEKPMLGWGAASSREIPGADHQIAPRAEVLSLHPHNHFLQTGLELGLVGAILYTAVLISIIWVIHTHLKSTLGKATAYGLFVALYIFGSAEHSLWHHWWVAWLGLFGCFAILICSQIDRLKYERPPAPMQR